MAALPGGRLRARSAAEHVRARIEGGEPVAARRALDAVLRSPEFGAAFRTGDVRGWPVGIMPALDAGAIDRVPRALRATLTPRAVLDDVAANKLARLHPEVSIEQYRSLQSALDRGELLVRARRGRDRYPSLLAHTPRGDGGWWRYAIRIEHDRDRLTFATVFAQRDAVRDELLAADYATVLRERLEG